MQIKCNNCGATQDLNVSNTCSYCGNKINFEEKQEIQNVQQNFENSNMVKMAEVALAARKYTEALNYYNKALEVDFSDTEAWLGKANTLLLSNSFRESFLKEVILYWENAIKYSKDPDSIIKKITELIIQKIDIWSPLNSGDYDGWQVHDYPIFRNFETILSFAISINNEKMKLYEIGYEIFNKELNLNHYKIEDHIKFENKYVEAINKLDPSRKLIPFTRSEIKQNKEVGEELDDETKKKRKILNIGCLLYTSPSPRD